MIILTPQTHLRGDYSQICDRLKRVRMQVCGRRGQSKFAFLMGLSPSTYNYYEKGRVPPVEVVDLASKISGAPLLWILRGEPENFDLTSLPFIPGESPNKVGNRSPGADTD